MVMDIILDLVDLFDRTNTKYHFDGSTVHYLHGMSVEMGDIDITYPFNDEAKIKSLFSNYELTETLYDETSGLKHFHFYMRHMKIHCLFYDFPEALFSDEDVYLNIMGRNVQCKSLLFHLRHEKDPNKKSEISRVIETHEAYKTL